MHRRRGAVVAMAVSAALVVGACSSGSPKRSLSTAASGGSMRDGAFSETGSPGGATFSESSAGSAAGAAAGSTTDAAAAPAARTSSGVGGAVPEPPQQQNQLGLRAGSVDDNARFAEYLAYVETFRTLGIKVKDFDVSERHVFTVRTPGGQPVRGADIVITGGQGQKLSELRTYSDGRALWFPRTTKAAQDTTTFKATVSAGGKTTSVTVDRKDTAHDVTLDAPSPGDRVAVDVEFLVDATGSMGDEISRLKQSLESISTRVAALPTHPDIRFALTVYRDRGDAFLTRTWNFSSDVAAFRRAIDGVEAGGGNDYPEEVQQGLHDAIVKPAWREPGTVKLVFLIGDAPPHLDYPDDADYVSDVVDAARQGIKIESLAASGLDDQGEFVWRQMAEATMGQFLFLTYGPDGGPGDATTHHVNGYSPTNLDDLVVDVVSREVAPGTVKGQ